MKMNMNMNMKIKICPDGNDSPAVSERTARGGESHRRTQAPPHTGTRNRRKTNQGNKKRQSLIVRRVA